MRTSNPALNDRTFAQYATAIPAGRAAGMTIDGVVYRTGLLVAVVAVAAVVAWTQRLSTGWAAATSHGAFVTAMVLYSRHRAAPIGAPVYALLKGLALGAISSRFEQRFPGIVIQAVALTLGTLFGLLAAYRFRLITVTENFKAMVLAATFGIFLTYLTALLLRLLARSRGRRR
jgi:uncharacterized YccA/Bax inhibitor family protein